MQFDNIQQNTNLIDESYSTIVIMLFKFDIYKLTPLSSILS